MAQPRAVDLSDSEVTTAALDLDLNTAWTTLTRKVNTITRLNARDKARLQNKVQELERALPDSTRIATVVKQDARRAQDKTKLRKT